MVQALCIQALSSLQRGSQLIIYYVRPMEWINQAPSLPMHPCFEGSHNQKETWSVNCRVAVVVIIVGITVELSLL